MDRLLGTSSIKEGAMWHIIIIILTANKDLPGGNGTTIRQHK
jgi:hypothetical protein